MPIFSGPEVKLLHRTYILIKHGIIFDYKMCYLGKFLIIMRFILLSFLYLIIIKKLKERSRRKYTLSEYERSLDPGRWYSSRWEEKVTTRGWYIDVMSTTNLQTSQVCQSVYSVPSFRRYSGRCDGGGGRGRRARSYIIGNLRCGGPQTPFSLPTPSLYTFPGKERAVCLWEQNTGTSFPPPHSSSVRIKQKVI